MIVEQRNVEKLLEKVEKKIVADEEKVLAGFKLFLRRFTGKKFFNIDSIPHILTEISTIVSGFGRRYKQIDVLEKEHLAEMRKAGANSIQIKMAEFEFLKQKSIYEREMDKTIKKVEKLFKKLLNRTEFGKTYLLRIREDLNDYLENETVLANLLNQTFSEEKNLQLMQNNILAIISNKAIPLLDNIILMYGAMQDRIKEIYQKELSAGIKIDVEKVKNALTRAQDDIEKIIEWEIKELDQVINLRLQDLNLYKAIREVI